MEEYQGGNSKKYRNKKWLAEQISQKSPAEIARECEISVKTIYSWLKKFDLPLPSERIERKYREKSWLKNAIEKMSVKEIAQECNVWPTTIIKWLRYHHLPVPPAKKPLVVQFAPHAKELVDALMLNGAHFEGTSGKAISESTISGWIFIRSQKIKYLEWLMAELQRANIPTRMRRSGKENILTTSSTTSLYQICCRWFKGGKKILPEDFELTPCVALIWFLNKGNWEKFSKSKRTSRAIRFWVKRFSPEDRQRLLGELKKKVAKDAVLYETDKIAMIRIPPHETSKFLAYIDNCQHLSDWAELKAAKIRGS